MRHQVRTKKLNKPTDHRKAMLKTLAAQVIQYEGINTTSAKGRAVLPLIDKVINIGKKKDLNAIRRLHKELYDELAIKKILEVLAEKYESRKSGYARVVKLYRREGDRAEMVRVMLTEN